MRELRVIYCSADKLHKAFNVSKGLGHNRGCWTLVGDLRQNRGEGG